MANFLRTKLEGCIAADTTPPPWIVEMFMCGRPLGRLAADLEADVSPDLPNEDPVRVTMANLIRTKLGGCIAADYTPPPWIVEMFMCGRPSSRLLRGGQPLVPPELSRRHAGCRHLIPCLPGSGPRPPLPPRARSKRRSHCRRVARVHQSRPAATA